MARSLYVPVSAGWMKSAAFALRAKSSPPRQSESGDGGEGYVANESPAYMFGEVMLG